MTDRRRKIRGSTLIPCPNCDAPAGTQCVPGAITPNHPARRRKWKWLKRQEAKDG